MSLFLLQHPVQGGKTRFPQAGHLLDPIFDRAHARWIDAVETQVRTYQLPATQLAAREGLSAKPRAVVDLRCSPDLSERKIAGLTYLQGGRF